MSILQVSEQYLNRTVACNCGKSHSVDIERVVVKPDAAKDLALWLQGIRARRVLLVSDEHTDSAFGKEVASRVSEGGIEVKPFVFPGEPHLLPDYPQIRQVQSELSASEFDCVVAVGSGVINDIVRYATYLEHKPYIVGATAASMDGYASTIAALQVDGYKLTLPAHGPRAIFADPSVLAQAPWELLQSGFGDLVGKVISLLDWKLSHLLYGEYFCKAAYQEVAVPLRFCVEHVTDIANRNDEAIGNLFTGLVNSGIAMAMVGNSRPASGCEHHCSHYWDFLAYTGTRPHEGHGQQVGYATHWMMDLYEWAIEGMVPIKKPVIPDFGDAWAAEVKRRYGRVADEIIREQRNKRAWLQERDSQFKGLESGFVDSLLAFMEPELTLFAKVRRALATMGIERRFDYLEVSADMLNETFLHANELRARYTLFDFLEGQGKRHEGTAAILAR